MAEVEAAEAAAPPNRDISADCGPCKVVVDRTKELQGSLCVGVVVSWVIVLSLDYQLIYIKLRYALVAAGTVVFDQSGSKAPALGCLQTGV